MITPHGNATIRAPYLKLIMGLVPSGLPYSSILLGQGSNGPPIPPSPKSPHLDSRGQHGNSSQEFILPGIHPGNSSPQSSSSRNASPGFILAGIHPGNSPWEFILPEIHPGNSSSGQPHHHRPLHHHQHHHHQHQPNPYPLNHIS